jgi:glycosyltransferase involved in cell wall biosynthesis
MDIPFTVVSPLLPDHNKCPHLDFEPAVVYLDYSNMGSFLQGVQDEIAMDDIGVIDVQCNVYLGVLGMMLSQKTKIPLISSFHMNLEYPDHAEAPFFAAHKELIEQTINESDAIVCVSKSVKESLLQFSTVTAPVYTIGNGVDTTVFCPRTKKENALLFVGRFSKEKNIPFLLRLYKEIAKKEDFKLWLVGDGPERKTINVMAQQLGIVDDIVYWGILTGNALAEVYAAAAVTVSPSVTEAFGMTTLESIACGTPVIASRTAGTNELLEQVQGASSLM